MTSTLAARDQRASWLLLLLLAPLVPLLVLAPIEQPAGYHRFADARTFGNVRNFWNVASNLPFLLVGLWGLRLLQRGSFRASAGWTVLFAGTVLVALGSGWYHLAPSDATLVWDRIAIGVAFMGFLSALVADYVSPRAGRRLLVPAIAFALGAVAWWRTTGDLSAWIWVQAGPMLAIALVLALFSESRAQGHWLLAALACYAAAKLAEVADHALYVVTGALLSGHAAKHLLAAGGVACLCMLLRSRGARAPGL